MTIVTCILLLRKLLGIREIDKVYFTRVGSDADQSRDGSEQIVWPVAFYVMLWDGLFLS